MAWTYKAGIPIYTQIISIIKTRIANGTYPAGTRLPAVRELAVDAGVNPNTMQRALAELERSGIIYSIRTSGRFVTEDTAMLGDLRKSLGREQIAALFASLRALGMTEDEIVAAVQEWRRAGMAEREVQDGNT
jgi:DNA-binding transcriptional regulator YhcF (GntR family)